MTMSADHRRSLSAGMARSADERQCERCGRRAAMVTKHGGGRTVYICRWALDRKCDDPGVARWT